MPSGSQFRTFQNVAAYDESLARHGQWIRWSRALTCPCLDQNLRQPNPKCSLCKGRGKIYRTPGVQSIVYETARHDSNGKVYPQNTPVSGIPIVYRRNVALTLAGSQPSPYTYIQLDPPHPKQWQELFVSYNFDPTISVTDEDSEVIATNRLRVTTPRFVTRGKPFEGSIAGVSRVYNDTKKETYTVTSFHKEYINLSSMGTWESGDALEVDYTYVKPFNFLLIGVTEKVRWESPWVLEQADSILMTPYWAKPSHDDLFTMLAGEQYGQAVIDPTFTVGNDVIKNYFDLSRIEIVVDENGTEYIVGTNLELFGRNEIKWLTTKPSVNYTVQFMFHPTYTALMNMSSVRTSENKAFINRINLVRFENVGDSVKF